MFSGEVAEKTSVFSYRMIIVKKMLLCYNCHILITAESLCVIRIHIAVDE